MPGTCVPGAAYVRKRRVPTRLRYLTCTTRKSLADDPEAVQAVMCRLQPAECFARAGQNRLTICGLHSIFRL